jgi:predicted dithiol-disulfide oxidoreductase (DUF899 family)
MQFPEIVSAQEWLTARKSLLVKEKELTRQYDAINADRRRLPMVQVNKKYFFEGEHGKRSLLDLFGGSMQLIVYHAMFDPQWDAACPGCTALLDEVSPHLLAHLRARDTAFASIARAPYPKMAAYKEARGWTLPWYSSYGSDFNYDFHVTLDAGIAPVLFNYRTPDELAAVHPGWLEDGSSEGSAFSCFLRNGDTVFHTYSAYGRGTEAPGIAAYSLLDLTALGRQEDWEEPTHRTDNPRSADPSFAS